MNQYGDGTLHSLCSQIQDDVWMYARCIISSYPATLLGQDCRQQVKTFASWSCLGMNSARSHNPFPYKRLTMLSTPLTIIPSAPIDTFAAAAVAAVEAVLALAVGESLMLPVLAAPVGSVWLAFLNCPVYVVTVTPVPFLHSDGVGVPLVNTISAHLVHKKVGVSEEFSKQV